MIIYIKGIEFSVRLQNDKFVAFRKKNRTYNKYKSTFDTFEKCIAYCERMAKMSELAKEAWRIAKNLSGKIAKWMYKKAKEGIEIAKDMFAFNAKCKYAR